MGIRFIGGGSSGGGSVSPATLAKIEKNKQDIADLPASIDRNPVLVDSLPIIGSQEFLDAPHQLTINSTGIKYIKVTNGWDQL